MQTFYCLWENLSERETYTNADANIQLTQLPDKL